MDREELNRRFEELGSRVGAVESPTHVVQAISPASAGVLADFGGADEELYPIDPPEEEGVMGGGDVTLRGTDGSELTSDDFTFVSAEDSNVTVTLKEETTGSSTKRKIEIGVYYV